MTDLATQPQADEASAQDDVEVEETVDGATDAELEGSATDDSPAETEPADEAEDAEDAADAEPGEEAATDAEAEAAEAETAAESEPAEPAEGEPEQPAEPAEHEAEPEQPAEPAEPAEDEAEPEQPAEPAEDEAETSEDVEPVDEADTDDEAEPETDEAEPEAVEAEEADAAAAVEETDPAEDAESDAPDAESDAPPIETELAEAADPEPEPDAPADAEPEDVTPAAESSDADQAATVAVATAVLAPAAEPEANDADDATTALPGVAAAAAAPPAGTDGAVYAWAEPDPTPKKKRTGLWLSIGAGVAAVGLVVTSLLLIAPGTTVAGVPVGWMTPGAAAGAIEQRLAETTVVLTGDGGDVEVTGAELGASVDAQALADTAFAEHPMWNPTAWFAQTGAEVELDTTAAVEALRDAAPALFTDPVDATLAYDDASTAYVSTPATPGTGIDVATVQQALQAAFEAGKTRVNLDPVIAEVPAQISTETAADTATKLNGMISNIGFYVGDERTVPVDRAVAASWLTVTPEDGAFTITADAAAIQPVVDTLAAAVDRAPQNAVEITDRAGKVLQTIAAGQSGRQLGATSGIAAAFASQLAGGDPVYKLPVDEVPVSTTTLARNVVVDLSDQAAYFYENGVVVNSTRMSSGLPGHDTHTGSFRITAKLRMQNMGNPDLTKAPYYYTTNVPWVMYFNGDQALHGAYWHNNFGNRMSHGCVNLPVGVAEFLYQWAPMGTEVTVQN